MKREDLVSKGLSAELVDFVMAEYGKDINPLKAERDSYKSQLDTARASLDAMKGVDVNGLQNKIQELTGQLQSKDGEIAQIKADYAFNALLQESIRKASGRNEKAITALLDVEALKASKNQEADVKTAIEALKKDNDYLFQSANVPRVVSSTPGMNPDAQTKKDQANEALRSLFGKE